MIFRNKIKKIRANYSSYFRVAESVVTGIFTLEWCLVVYSTDGEFSRLCSWRTITDGLSICPFYLKVFITILLSARGRQDMAENLATRMEDSIFKETFSYLRVSSCSPLSPECYETNFYFQTLRILRLFRLSRYMSSIRLIGRTITVCKDDFAFLIFLFVLITIFYSTCVYMLEEDNFQSIPASMWWSAITMTTVGYGDFCPKTNMARIRTRKTTYYMVHMIMIISI